MKSTAQGRLQLQAALIPVVCVAFLVCLYVRSSAPGPGVRGAGTGGGPLVAGLNYLNMDERLDRLYGMYAHDLAALHATLREWCAVQECLSNPVEVEVSYMRLRSARPSLVWEVSPHMGYTTMVILTALRDNGYGQLMSFDYFDKCTRNVPTHLSAGGRWTFIKGDIRTSYTAHAAKRPDYLFLDSHHSHEYGEFYTTKLFPWMGPRHLYVSLHDVYNVVFWRDGMEGRNTTVYPEWMPNEEGLTVIDWLKDQPDMCGVYSLASGRNAAQRAVFARVQEMRRRHLGTALADATMWGTHSTLFFELHCYAAVP